MNAPTAVRRPRMAAMPLEGLARRASVRTWPRQVDHHLRRWFAVPVDASVRVAPRRNVHVAASGAAPEYLVLLRSWRRVVLGWRLLAVGRRAAILAAVAALILLLAYRLWSVPWPVAAVAGLVTLLAGLAVGIARTPALQPVTHFLDRQLTLHDQLTTALELAPRGGAEDTIYNRLHRQAARLAQTYRQTWRVRPAAAIGEWAALGVLLLALVACLAVPSHAAVIPHPVTGRGSAAPVSAGTPLHRVRVSVSTIPSTPYQSPPRASHHTSGSNKTSTRAGTTGHNSHHSQQPPAGNGSPNQALAPGKSDGRASGSHKNSHGLPFLKGGSSSGSNNHHAQARGSGTQRRQRTGKHASAAGGSAPAPSKKPGHVKGKLLHSHSPGGSGQSGGRSTKGQSGKKAGGTSPTKQKSPYGGSLPFLHSLPKPGLITGKGFSANTHNKGSNSAGHDRGAKNGQHLTHPHLGSSNGKNVSLHSGYAHGPGHGRKQSSSIPGKRGGTAHVRGASLGAQAIDYVPSDPNQVPAGQSGAVSRYFTPPTGKTSP